MRINFIHKKRKYNNSTERVYAMDVTTKKRVYLSISFGRDPKLILKDDEK